MDKASIILLKSFEDQQFNPYAFYYQQKISHSKHSYMNKASIIILKTNSLIPMTVMVELYFFLKDLLPLQQFKNSKSR